jgi:hypothetical protein
LQLNSIEGIKTAVSLGLELLSPRQPLKKDKTSNY